MWRKHLCKATQKKLQNKNFHKPVLFAVEIHIAVTICNQTEINIARWTGHPNVALTQSTVFLVSLWFWAMSYFIISNVVDWVGTVGFFPHFRVGSVLTRLVGRPLTEFGFNFRASTKALAKLDVNSDNGFFLLAGKPNCLWCLSYKIQAFNWPCQQNAKTL